MSILKRPVPWLILLLAALVVPGFPTEVRMLVRLW
jgi:hypothetical protein